jgi:integrase
MCDGTQYTRSRYVDKHLLKTPADPHSLRRIGTSHDASPWRRSLQPWTPRLSRRCRRCGMISMELRTERKSARRPPPLLRRSRRLLRHLPATLRDAATIIAEEGMRPGEVFALRWPRLLIGEDGTGLIRVVDGKSKAASP